MTDPATSGAAPFDADVAIVGGGPVGALLANLLGQALARCHDQIDMRMRQATSGAGRETAHTARSPRERVVLSLLAFAGLVVSATGAVALLVSAVNQLAHPH